MASGSKALEEELIAAMAEMRVAMGAYRRMESESQGKETPHKLRVRSRMESIVRAQAQICDIAKGMTRKCQDLASQAVEDLHDLGLQMPTVAESCPLSSSSSSSSSSSDDSEDDDSHVSSRTSDFSDSDDADSSEQDSEWDNESHPPLPAASYPVESSAARPASLLPAHLRPRPRHGNKKKDD